MTLLKHPTSFADMLRKYAAILVTGTLVYGCTEGGPETVANNNNGNNGGGGSNYSGPPPANNDVQRFQTYFWNNISSQNSCGGCHNEGGQAPTFARSDDINLAYAEALTVVDLDTPVDSRLVTKVGGGHNCWLGNNQACADTMTSYIENWLNSSASATTEIVLTDPPNLDDPGTTRTFPDDPGLFQSTVYPVLTQYCAGCHADSASTPISPFFASSDISTAYNAAKSKIDLDTPANSRFVLRLRNEFHNCWDDCQSNSNTMEAAIQAFSDAIPLDTLDPSAVHSKALTLLDGIPASSGGRHESDAIATWQFKAGSGSTAYDTSGISPALNLSLTGEVEWVGGWGINIKGGKAQGSTTNSAKLHDMIKTTNEYSIEGWFAPGNVSQEGPARIVSYSGGASTRNFMLGQTLYNYDFLNRSTNADANGDPSLSTADADERLQATLQHVVVTYDPVNGRRIYVNGNYTGDQDDLEPGTLNDWDNTFALVLGSETNNDFKWAGVIKFLSIHNKALTQEQISQNFEAGVGERFYLLFNISQVIDSDDAANGTNTARAYVVFEASQFDSYSYLFNAPFFISLNDTFVPNNIPMRGISIGINGKEATVGQAYRKIDISLNSNDYNADTGQIISPFGTIISLEKGSSNDEFFLTFERLADRENVRIEAEPQPLPTPPDVNPAAPQIGVRTFEEIYATLSQMTGISMNNANVRSVFLTVKQQLPTKEDVESFLSSHQMGVTQMAIEYCSALMDDTSLRSTTFAGFDFTAQPATAFANADLLLDPLLDRAMGTGLNSQPAAASVKGELNALITELTSCGNACEAGRTVKVAKAVCAAATGSAIMLIQ